MLVFGGVPVVSAPYETRKSLTPRAVLDIAPFVWAAQFDDSSDKYCTDFKCPEYYDLVNNADTTVCEDRKCTKDVCCEPTGETGYSACLLYTSPSPRDRQKSRMPSSA